MSALLCPVIIGREKELASLSQSLRAAMTGKGGALFVLGEAGIGKTRLTDEITLEAEALGMRVLRGRAVEGGAQLPFRPLAEAFQAAFRMVGRLPPELAPYGRVLGKVVPQWAEDKPPSETNPLLLFEAIVQFLRLIGERSGALIILEDLHWADAETLSAVEYLADHLSGTRVACVVTSRSDEPFESARVLARIATRFPRSRLVLERLSTALVEEMARQTLGDTPVTSDLLSVMAERSEGVPLLVEELSSACADAAERGFRQGPAQLQALPSSYAMVIERRLATLSEDATAVVSTAAVIGPDLRPEVLSAVTTLTKRRVADALREGLRAHLLIEDRHEGSASLTFRHVLVADAVLAQLLPDERRDLHARAADAIQRLFPGLPGEWCNRVAQLRLNAGDHETASGLLVEVGRRALKRGALLTAEQALERARALVQGDRWKTTGIDRVFVRVLSLLGNTRRLRELGDSAIAFMAERPDLLGTPERQGEVLLQIARGIASARDWVLVRERMEPVAELAELSAGEEFPVRARSFEGRVALELGDLDLAETASSAALSDGERLGVVEAVCEAKQVKAGVALAKNDLDGAADALHEAKLYAERRDLSLWRVEILLDLAAMDEASTASLDNIAAARDLVRVTEAPLAQARVDLQMARMRLARFELDLAEESLGRAIEMCYRYQLPLLPEALAIGAQAAALRGDTRRVRSCLKEAKVLTLTPADRIAFHEADVMLKLVRGDLAGVNEPLARAVELIPYERREQHRWLGGLWALIRALGGDFESEPSAARDSNPFRRHADAVRHGNKGETEAAEAQFAAADSQLESFPWRRSLARRLVAEASLKDRWGDPGAWVAEASAFFDSADQAGLASACKGLLRRAGVTVPRRGRGKSTVPEVLRAFGITSREMDVLGLVREGRSNKEIAERLYLSIRTVESHVASAMRKIGTGSRPQLVAFLLDEHVTPG